MSELWLILAAMAALSLIGAIVKSPWFKGRLGELQVNFAVSFILDRRTYHLLRDVTLPTEDGSTQIDHIIVSRYGVFVVETKRMQGWIFGREREPYWTQQIYRHKQRFQNPLRQNYKHTRALIELLDLPEEVVKPMIVFLGGARLMKEVPESVTTGWDFLGYIKAQTEVLLQEEEVAAIADGIRHGALGRDRATRARHIEHVRAIKASKAAGRAAVEEAGALQLLREVDEAEGAEEAEAPTCPRCGSDMVLRQARKGEHAGDEFWGCSRFPRCRGKRVAVEAGA